MRMNNGIYSGLSNTIMMLQKRKMQTRENIREIYNLFDNAKM